MWYIPSCFSSNGRRLPFILFLRLIIDYTFIRIVIMLILD